MRKWNFLVLAMLVLTSGLHAEELDLFILAGQSNAQGWQGDARYYPEDPDGIDSSVRFYWVTPNHSSSEGKWQTLKAQGGRFKQGHFGPEITLGRALKKAGYHPAIFKYSLGSTSLAVKWQGPGAGKLYDQMIRELKTAIQLLEKEGHRVHPRCFIWIQGESDAETVEMANAYKGKLKTLLDDLRRNVLQIPELPVILGLDEQHPWVKERDQVVKSQQALAVEEKAVVFTSMLGLEKADSTHLTPKGIQEQGKRIYEAYVGVIKSDSDKKTKFPP